MALRAIEWTLALVVLAWLVSDVQASSSRLRTVALKTVPPFIIDPGTFLNTVAAVQSDTLLLFFSPTCPDCEKLMPLWSRVAGLFEDSQDLTILSVSDDEGKAPPPYTHDENPAVFFIPRGEAAHPILFPMSDLHEFVGLPETGNTDDDIVNKLVAFVHSHATVHNAAPLPVPVRPAEPAAPPSALSESQGAALTARLLASLKAKEAATMEEQLKLVYEPHYQGLPVVEFLKSPSGGGPVSSAVYKLGPPLAVVAATYLDGLPMAAQWAKQYAAQQDANYRSHGWNPTPEEERSYVQDLLDYALPLYARSVYAQKGLK